MSATSLGTAFLLAAVVILVTCRVVSWALRPLLQPPVVAEMLAGVLLGPSVLGLLAPRLEHAVFPADLRPVLYVAGQLGLALSCSRRDTSSASTGSGRSRGRRRPSRRPGSRRRWRWARR
ncbi:MULTISPECIES: hypothetical protein [unclassified Streptomyces]|uniref:hypothetical protein n=1 Tax=unclassified Streptomyces TaxID=2593676 RepID=UPI000AD05201|nr:MULTISPECIES: hypothetical protein [unclassified Streptomyces]